MIKKISDFKYKSWKSESKLSSIEFNETNITFGHNGAGKSSLAYGVYAEYLKTGGDKNSIRLFGGKYVDNTLLLEDKAGIKGVVSNFGEKDVDLEEKILKNNTRIAELEIESKKQTTEHNTLSAQTETLIKEIVARRKDKNKKINNKASDKTVSEKVQLWIDDYNKAHKDFPNEDYNLITGSIDYSSENEQVNALQIAEKVSYEEDFTAHTIAILEKSYVSVDIPSSEVVSWLQSGLHIHADKDICEFCGNKLNIDVITARISSFVNNERYKAILQLEGYRDTLDKLIKLAEDVVNDKKTYVTLLGFNEDDFARIGKTTTLLNDTSTKTIATKLKDMSTTGTITYDLLAEIKIIDDIVKKLTEAKSRRSKEIVDKINRLEALVKGSIGFEIKNSITINQNLDKLSEYVLKLKKLRDESEQLGKNNAKLSSQKSDLADFSIYLNDILSELNLNFKLEPNGEYYVLKHTDGTTLKVSDISDGERNLLALIYFYYEMLDNSGIVKSGIELIIIDDPISSLDDGNKFYITELVKSMLIQGKAQIFVFTHSWDDFCNLTYGQSEIETVSRFEITKNTGISSLNLMDGKRLVRPYKALYKEVSDFSQMNVSDITSENVLHMPNIMRRVLEEYIKFVVDVDFATAHKNGDISKALFGEEIAKISNTKKQKLSQLLAICNILSHKANQPRNGNEVHESAKFLINTINEFNKFHHLKMVE